MDVGALVRNACNRFILIENIIAGDEPEAEAKKKQKSAPLSQAAKLVQMFADNFAQYVPFIDDDVKAVAIG